MSPNSPATTREESQSVSGNEKGGLTSLRNHKRFTTIPVVTREEPRVSYRNLSKTTRFHLQCKMMPDSPALPPEQFHLPQPAQEHCHKSRGTPRSLPQSKRAPCTPKSYRDVGQFPCFTSRGMLAFHSHLKRRLLCAIGM